MAKAHLILREATHEWHQRVEELSLFKKLMYPEVSVEDLLATLSLLYAFYERVESAIQPYFSQTSTLPYDSKKRALEADLTLLGALTQQVPGVFEVKDVAVAWGARYVLEGASLGRKVIARHLKKRLPAIASSLQFYQLEPDVETSWSHLVSALEAELQTPAQIDRATTAACDTFELLYNLAKLQRRDIKKTSVIGNPWSQLDGI